MHLFSDEFMEAFVSNAKEAAAESDEGDRAGQMAALAAHILAWLATSEVLKPDAQEQAAMLVVVLVVSFRLEMKECGALGVEVMRREFLEELARANEEAERANQEA